LYTYAFSKETYLQNQPGLDDEQAYKTRTHEEEASAYTGCMWAELAFVNIETERNRLHIPIVVVKGQR
jgi:hypothetical protein